MSSLWVWGVDYQHQPLLDAWWTPGWTAQNKDYIQVPGSNFLNGGFPPNLTYVTVTGSYFDLSSDPISGYFTFWPSTSLVYTSNGQSTFFPQRYAGINETLIGINQMGDGKIYLQYGNLSVNLLATDNTGFVPSTFTYHVEEHFLEGRQYDITVPSADAPAVDITSLIIPGSIKSMKDDLHNEHHNRVEISQVSTQYLISDVSDCVPAAITQLILSNYSVNFAFISGSGIPTQSTTWLPGSWATTSSPYYAQILIGPGSGGVPLAVGSYRVWIQLEANPQVPVFSAGYVDIF